MKLNSMIRSYTELKELKSFEDRFRYLKLSGTVGEVTFGYERYLNQSLYTSRRWRRIRDEVIMRDMGCDLGVEGYEIYDKVVVHHMNPICAEDIEMERDIVFDPEYLICTSNNTHQAIHYGDESLIPQTFVERTKNDTCPWK